MIPMMLLKNDRQLVVLVLPRVLGRKIMDTTETVVLGGIIAKKEVEIVPLQDVNAVHHAERIGEDIDWIICFIADYSYQFLHCAVLVGLTESFVF